MLDFYLLIPCFNNHEGLIRSLNSVEYPKEKYKVVVVDDGSTIPVTAAVFPEYLLQKQSIEIIRLPENRGITQALNHGLRYILEKNDAWFTARLDCGDICTSDRFYKQIQFLHVNTYVSLLGSLCLFADRKKNSQFRYIAKENHPDILREMHWKCSFIHPTVIFRNSALKETNLYPDAYPSAEDYALFFELVKKFKTHILQEFLVESEVNTNGISVKKRQEQTQSKVRIIKTFGVTKSLIFIGLLRQFFLAMLPYKLSIRFKNALFTNNK